MSSDERRKFIMKTAEHDGMVSIPDVAARFGVSVETIRRDVNALCSEKKLSKVHGGAVAYRKTDDSKEHPSGKKETIGTYAASLIESGDVVMFDSGDAARAVAAEVRGVRGVTFITNSVTVASELMKRHLAGHYSGRIILIGGELDPKYAFSRSPDTLKQIAKLRADKAFITASGVTGEGVSADGTYESSFSAAMMEHSERSYLVCESVKFGHGSLAFFSPLSAFAEVVTDPLHKIPADIVAEIEKNGGKIEVTGTK